MAMVIENEWDEITVQRLCERADVGRSTFYTHFADKEDVLLSGFDELRLHLSPLVLGGGTRLFDLAGRTTLVQRSVTESPRATHITYEVVRD